MKVDSCVFALNLFPAYFFGVVKLVYKDIYVYDAFSIHSPGMSDFYADTQNFMTGCQRAN